MSFTALVPKINSIQVEPAVLVINQSITIKVSAEEAMTTLWEVASRSGAAASGQEPDIRWPVDSDWPPVDDRALIGKAAIGKAKIGKGGL